MKSGLSLENYYREIKFQFSPKKRRFRLSLNDPWSEGRGGIPNLENERFNMDVDSQLAALDRVLNGKAAVE